jgi:hypothetical protein
MNRPPNTDQEFLSTVHRWLAEHGEVLVFIEIVASAPEPYLFKNREHLHGKIEELNKICIEQRPYLSVYGAFALKNFEFPLRGVMDEAFVKAALDMLSKEKGAEFLLLELDEEGYYRWGEPIERPEELLSELDEYLGKVCVFGKCPDYGTSPEPGLQVETAFPITLE